MNLANKSAETTGNANTMNTKQNDIIQNTASMSEEIAQNIECENSMLVSIADLAQKSKDEVTAISQKVDSLNATILELDGLLKH